MGGGDGVPAEAQAKVDALESAVRALEDAVAPVAKRPLRDTATGAAPLERAHLAVTLAHAAAAAFAALLKAQGVRPADHPVAQELERIDRYAVKVRRAAVAAGEPPPGPATAGEPQPPAKKQKKKGAAAAKDAADELLASMEAAPPEKATKEKRKGTPEGSTGSRKPKDKKAKKA